MHRPDGGHDRAQQNTNAAFRACQRPTIVKVYEAGTVNFTPSDVTKSAVNCARDRNVRINGSDHSPGVASYRTTSRGEMWSFPHNSSTATLYCNLQAFARIGRTAAPTTWQELERDMRAMKAAGHACPMAIDFDAWQFERLSAIHNPPIATRNSRHGGLNAEWLPFDALLPVLGLGTAPAVQLRLGIRPEEVQRVPLAPSI